MPDRTYPLSPTSSPRTRARLAVVLPLTNSKFTAPTSARPIYDLAQLAKELSILYSSSDREEVRDFVEENYFEEASFENPLSIGNGSKQIADIFCLLELVPGRRWSEVCDVAEAHSYDGNRLVILSHVLHLSLFPSLAQHLDRNHPAHPSYSSVPSTPFPQQSGSTWPFASVLNLLKPRAILSRFSQIHLKIHTKLVFNEHGLITRHEDVFGLKEIIEAFPLFATAYNLNRHAIGLLASTVSRALIAKSLLTTKIETNSLYTPGSPIQSRSSSRKSTMDSNTGEGLGFMQGMRKPSFSRESQEIGMKFAQKLKDSGRVSTDSDEVYYM